MPVLEEQDDPDQLAGPPRAGARGVFPTTGVTPAPTYPGNAPLQSVGGPVDNGLGLTTFQIAEGVDGHAAVDSTDPKARGAGVIGTSDFGIGVVGAGATDQAALGAGPPANRPQHDFAQVRDVNGVLWLSSVGGTWRRNRGGSFVTASTHAVVDPC